MYVSSFEFSIKRYTKNEDLMATFQADCVPPGKQCMVFGPYIGLVGLQAKIINNKETIHSFGTSEL